MLTDEQKDKIRTLRMAGWGYRSIANKLEISVNTIKSFCRRHDVPVERGLCRYCGGNVRDIPGKKKKIFCNDSCRSKYWAEHRNEISTASVFTCRHCGKEFRAYGRRKYCSEPCYFAERFGDSSENGLSDDNEGNRQME